MADPFFERAPLLPTIRGKSNQTGDPRPSRINDQFILKKWNLFRDSTLYDDVVLN